MVDVIGTEDIMTTAGAVVAEGPTKVYLPALEQTAANHPDQVLHRYHLLLCHLLHYPQALLM